MPEQDKSCQRFRPGVTLIEVLIVLVVLAILVGLLPPALHKFRESAARAQCVNQLKQLAATVNEYVVAKGVVPFGLLRDQPSSNPNPGFPHPDRVAGNSPPFSRYSLIHQLLPYLGQEEMWKGWDPVNFNTNKASGFMRKALPILICPANANARESFNTYSNPSIAEVYFITSYLGSAGTRGYPRWVTPPDPRLSLFQYQDGFFQQNSQAKPADFTDGLSSTLMLGERFYLDPVFDAETDSKIGNWGWCWFGAQGDVFLGANVPINFKLPNNFKDLSPGNKQRFFDDRVNAYGSGHDQGACFAMGDGSARFISEGISQLTLEALGTRAGGEKIEE